MTGKEWAVCEDPRLMVDALRRRTVSDRKWRLFVAAFWRQQAENVLAGTREELVEVSSIMEDWADTGQLPKDRRSSPHEDRIFFARDAALAAVWTVNMPNLWLQFGPKLRMVQADLLREILGNPFRLPDVDSRWRTSDVLGLARAIYEDRAYERMPILADALMDAGCEQEAIIGHCRGEFQHVRGCWVLDLVLGKD